VRASGTVTEVDRKTAAKEFLRMASTGDVRRAFARYSDEGMRHHNPYVRGDAESLALAMEENAEQFPKKALTVLHAIEEGDLVATYSRVRLKPDGPDMAVVHLFRFEGDRIVEMWDVGQAAPEDSPNENGMF
jgi:predicted SnoaL-like aldol condensation-catalyzing enzyme